MENFIEVVFDYVDGNNVRYVDAYTSYYRIGDNYEDNAGVCAGYIINKTFYPTNPDYLTNDSIMTPVNNYLKSL